MTCRNIYSRLYLPIEISIYPKQIYRFMRIHKHRGRYILGSWFCVRVSKHEIKRCISFDFHKVLYGSLLLNKWIAIVDEDVKEPHQAAQHAQVPGSNGQSGCEARAFHLHRATCDCVVCDVTCWNICCHQCRDCCGNRLRIKCDLMKMTWTKLGD